MFLIIMAPPLGITTGGTELALPALMHTDYHLSDSFIETTAEKPTLYTCVHISDPSCKIIKSSPRRARGEVNCGNLTFVV